MPSRDDLIREMEKAAEMKELSMKGDEVVADISAWDSMAMLNLISAIDIQYGVYLDMDQFEMCKTVSDVVDYIQKVIAEEG